MQKGRAESTGGRKKGEEAASDEADEAATTTETEIPADADDEKAEQLLKEKDYLQDKSIKKVSLATIKRRKEVIRKMEEKKDVKGTKRAIETRQGPT